MAKTNKKSIKAIKKVSPAEKKPKSVLASKASDKASKKQLKAKPASNLKKIAKAKESPVKIKVSDKKNQKLEESSLKKTKNSDIQNIKKNLSENPTEPVKKLGILQKKAEKKEKSQNPTKAQLKEEKKNSESEISLSSASTKWLQFYKKYGNLEAPEYNMGLQFEEKTPLVHPKLGWGFIMSIINDRLEVLFQEGTKTLISNYNPDLKL